jgi:hypothetical protein
MTAPAPLAAVCPLCGHPADLSGRAPVVTETTAVEKAAPAAPAGPVDVPRIPPAPSPASPTPPTRPVGWPADRLSRSERVDRELARRAREVWEAAIEEVAGDDDDEDKRHR